MKRADIVEQYVAPEEAAGLFGVHPKTLTRLARLGRVPAHPFGDGQRKRWRFLLSELDEWMRARVTSCHHPRRVEGESL